MHLRNVLRIRFADTTHRLRLSCGFKDFMVIAIPPHLIQSDHIFFDDHRTPKFSPSESSLLSRTSNPLRPHSTILEGTVKQSLVVFTHTTWLRAFDSQMLPSQSLMLCLPFLSGLAVLRLSHRRCGQILPLSCHTNQLLS